MDARVSALQEDNVNVIRSFKCNDNIFRDGERVVGHDGERGRSGGGKQDVRRKRKQERKKFFHGISFE
jgi:hypothetical protein